MKLFSSFSCQNVLLKNRIVMSPMCMYSANSDGKLTPFHFTHYLSRAVGQVGLIMVEATAVQPEGRISPNDLGIWDDDQISHFQRLNEQIHLYGAKTAIQLAHAGRKAKLDSEIYAPSALPYNNQAKKPLELSKNEIKNIINAFKVSAKRAKEANFDIIEIHAAHGYLINQFLSPLTNHRNDEYGGNRENRYRFLKEIIENVKIEWNHAPIFVRISTNEYDPCGNNLEDILYFVKQMKEQGINLIDCSSGGVIPVAPHAYPGYQVKRCQLIKEEVNIATGAVGLITTGVQAEEILQNDRADLVFIGRPLLKNPYWVKACADELNFNLPAPKQYTRGW